MFQGTRIHFRLLIFTPINKNFSWLIESAGRTLRGWQKVLVKGVD